MNTRFFRQMGLFAVLYGYLAVAGCAGERSSARYAIPTEAFSGGQASSQSANYGNFGMIEPFVGIAHAAPPAMAVRHGYLGQLYEVVALQLAAMPTTMFIGQTRQVRGFLLLDDLSSLAVSPNAIAWSIQSGPLQSISTGGLAWADTVMQDTLATVRGSYAGLTASLGLTVVAVNSTNILDFAFGHEPAQGGPVLLPQPQLSGGDLLLTFTQPVEVSGITYGAEWSPTLADGSWTPVPDSGAGITHTFRVLRGDHQRIFMRLKVTGP